MIMMIWYNDIRWALSELAIFAATFCAHGQCHRCRRPFQSPQVPRRRACSCELVAVMRCPQWHWRWHPKSLQSRRGSFLVLLHLLRDFIQNISIQYIWYSSLLHHVVSRKEISANAQWQELVCLWQPLKSFLELQIFKRFREWFKVLLGLLRDLVHFLCMTLPGVQRRVHKPHAKIEAKWTVVKRSNHPTFFPCEKRLGSVTKLLSRKSMIGVVQVHHW